MNSSSTDTKRTTRLMLLLLGAIFVFAATYTYDQKVALLGDNVNYYLLGQSLADGAGFVNINTIEELPSTNFPPGYPAIISAFVTIGAEITGIKVLNYCFLFSAVLLLFFIIKQIAANHHVAFVVSLGCILNVHLLGFSTVMMSEMPFFFFFLLSIFFLLRVKSRFNWKDYNFWLFLLALVFAYHIRTMGIALIVAVGAYFLFSKRWKHLGLTALGVVLLSLPWYLRTKQLGGGAYLGNLLAKNHLRPELGMMEAGDWWVRISANVQRYITREIPSSLYPTKLDYNLPYGALEWILGLLLLAAIIYGLLQLKQGRLLIGSFCLGTFAILLCWPEIWFGQRFILPLIPLFLLGLTLAVWRGVEAAQSKWGNKDSVKAQRIAVYLPVLILTIATFPALNNLHAEAVSEYPDGHRRYIELAEWIGANTSDEAVIACRKPKIFYLFSGRKAIRYPYEVDPDDFLKQLEASGANLLVFDELGYSSYEEYLMPAANYFRGKFVIRKQIGESPTQLCSIHFDLGYFGERLNGQKSGIGTFTGFDGSTYQGSWLNDQQHGFGQMRYPDGNWYRGDWSQNQRHGQGTLFTADSIILQQGEWEHGLFVEEALDLGQTIGD